MANLPFTIGVEIEITHVAGVNIDEMRQREFLNNLVAPFSTLGHKYKVVSDSSCAARDERGVLIASRGWEVVSPVIRTEAQLETLRKVLLALKEAGAVVDGNCGLHVHVGFDSIANTPAEHRILGFLTRYESAFFALASGREQSCYCQPLREAIVKKIKNGYGINAWEQTSHKYADDRYHWLNGCSYYHYNTLEFRVMNGSVDADFILGYIDFILHIMDATVNHFTDKVRVGKSKSTSPALLVHNLLSRAGTYGKKLLANPERAVRARKWALARFAQIHGRTHRQVLRAEMKAKAATKAAAV